jgi:Xaa-Pro aminopeptidase
VNPAFAERRARLIAELGPRAVAIVPGAALRGRNGDVVYRFRQDSDFHYLCGFPEPDAVLVLTPGREAKTTLFVRPRDPEREIWDGHRAGVDGAVAEYGIDAAFPIGELDARAPTLLEDTDDLYFALGRDAAWDARVTGWLERVRGLERKGVQAPRRICDPREPLAEMRLRKAPEELALLRRAAAVTAEAHLAAIRAAQPGAWEFEIEATIEHAFRRRGASGPGYTTIVGAGATAALRR